MSARLNTQVIARRENVEHADTLDFAFLGESDFYRALASGLDLHGWARYEDFRDERDAQVVGLSTSGFLAFQTRVAFSCFQDWLAQTGFPRTVQSLDDFAGLVRTALCHPDARVEPIEARNWSPSVHRRALVSRRLLVPIARRRYVRWVEALASVDMAPSRRALHAYARLLIQQWCDRQALVREPAE